MAYDDGYYYGQCKIVAVVDNTEDNGKTVLITTDDNKTYSGTIANKKCEFLLPPRTLYTVQKVSGESAEFTTKVEAGYGDCILVHLDTGYVEVKQGDIVGLDYIKAATADALKNKVPEANAVKTLNSSLSEMIKTYYYNTGETPTTIPRNTVTYLNVSLKIPPKHASMFSLNVNNRTGNSPQIELIYSYEPNANSPLYVNKHIEVPQYITISKTDVVINNTDKEVTIYFFAYSNADIQTAYNEVSAIIVPIS